MKAKNSKNIYKQMQRFADLTKTLIIQGNIARAKKCLAVAEKLFETGSNEMKNAVSNVFVFSVSSFMEVHHCHIKDLFPKSLDMEYHKQVNASNP
ncbi:MAG: hypothetical protein ABI723_22555 [Bacteroidia bacterium]